MKTFNRMALGTISSLLLSAGLARAAQKLDPLTKTIGGRDFRFNSTDKAATGCVLPCFIQTE
jgi:hypothetical protein